MAQFPIAITVRFHTAPAASCQTLPSHCSIQGIPTRRAWGLTKKRIGCFPPFQLSVSLSHFPPFVKSRVWHFLPFTYLCLHSDSPSSLGSQRRQALLELQHNFVVKATRTPIRPWEEALFINSSNNYIFFVELHDYLSTCSNKVCALNAKSLGPMSTNSWWACRTQASFLTQDRFCSLLNIWFL